MVRQLRYYHMDLTPKILCEHEHDDQNVWLNYRLNNLSFYYLNSMNDDIAQAYL